MLLDTWDQLERAVGRSVLLSDRSIARASNHRLRRQFQADASRGQAELVGLLRPGYWNLFSLPPASLRFGLLAVREQVELPHSLTTAINAKSLSRHSSFRVERESVSGFSADALFVRHSRKRLFFDMSNRLVLRAFASQLPQNYKQLRSAFAASVPSASFSISADGTRLFERLAPGKELRASTAQERVHVVRALLRSLLDHVSKEIELCRGEISAEARLDAVVRSPIPEASERQEQITKTFGGADCPSWQFTAISPRRTSSSTTTVL